MSISKHLFQDFSKVSPSEWMAKIEKDLKGKPLEDLQWQPDSDLNLNPFATAHTATARPGLNKKQRRQNQWQLLESISVQESTVTNQQVLKALAGGAQGIWLDMSGHGPEALPSVLKDVYLDYISVHFSGFSQRPISEANDFLRAYHELAKSRGLTGTQLQGSIDVAFPERERAIKQFDALHDYCQQHLSHFAVATVQVPDHDVEGGSPPAYLAELLAKGSDWLAFAKSNENRPAAEQIQFSVGIGKSYFLNIALLRAFRLLWANILKSYELPFGKLAAVHSYVLFEDAEMDTNTQIIYATTQAMAAVLGGSSSVRIWPRVAGDERSFVQHIVRNLQHLFQMESYLDRVVDPAEGSYYIEQLTNQLAQAAWTRFQAIEYKKRLP